MMMAGSDYMPEEYPDFGNVGSVNDWSGPERWNAVYTVTLGELIEHGVFDWESPELDWSRQAYSAEQYRRVCDYFVERFRYREISMEPYLEWAQTLHRKLAYELMPKYAPLYAMAEDGIDPAQTSDKYRKRRAIGSDYPETLLSGNSDYASNGQDEEAEDVERGNLAAAYSTWQETFKGVDELLLNELECMFIGLYTANFDGM